MAERYAPLEQYLRKLPPAQEEVTLSFEIIEGILQDSLPLSALENRTWWDNQQRGTRVETIAWMDAGWLVETVDLTAKWVRFVRQ